MLEKEVSETKMPNNWDEIRRRVLRRDKYQCQLCGSKEKLEVHHIIPRSEGGSNDMRNLITLCYDCHNYVEMEGLTYNEILEHKKRLQEEREQKKKMRFIGRIHEDSWKYLVLVFEEEDSH